MEFLEFRKKPGQLRFHSMEEGSEVFPSHFTDLLKARLSTSITSPIFKKNSNSCSIALCNTSWQLMTKWEVEIGPFFFKDHWYYFTHQLSLMNCVIQPQENLLEKLFSPKELLWKPFLIVFSGFDNFLDIKSPPSPSHEPVQECCSLSAFLSFHLSMRRIKSLCAKISMKVLYLEHSSSKMNMWGKPEVLFQSLPINCILKCWLNLTCKR